MAELKNIVWLAQAGFIFDLDGARVVVDPYMTNSCGAPRGRFERMSPPPMSFEELKPDFVFFSHDHRDHYDDESVPPIYNLHKNCFFAGPISTYEHFKAQGFDTLRFQTLAKGNSYDFKLFRVSPLTAYHSDPHALGYVFDFGGRKVYFSGDTEYSETLADDVKAAAGGAGVDIAFIVINGKLGNMNWREAAKLAGQIKPRQVVPMHYGLFAANTENPAPFKASAEAMGIACSLPEIGKRLQF